MKKLLKPIKSVVLFLVIAAVSPFILAKLGFWESTFAQQPKFQKSNDPINYGTTVVSYADAIARAAPAVVSIQSTKEVARDNPLMRDPAFRQFFGDIRQMPQELRQGIGSGVIVTQDGYVLTNNHVINGANEIKVKLSDGRESVAKLVGSDPDTDLAILKVDITKLPVMAIGSSDHLRVGDVVFAIGNPFGVGQTVTQGIVSATHRSEMGINTFENFIQTDAAINPGNSGGALIDINGNLIGINNAIYSRTGGYQGIGFAIPISIAKDVMAELIDQGHVTRGWLGLSLSKLNPESRKSLNYAKGDGVVVAGVIRNGPAFNGGLRPGDVIISLDNKPVTTPSEVLGIASKLKPESPYPIAVSRNGQILDFRVVIGKRPTQNNNANAPLNQSPEE